MTAQTITSDHQHQAANWRWLVVVLAIALFGTWGKDVASQWIDRNDRQRIEAVQNCRSKVAAQLSAAQVDNDVAFNQLVVALTDPARRPYAVEIKRITDTGRSLEVARDARLAFENHPTSKC